MTRKPHTTTRKAHTILTIDNWIIWDYADPPFDDWHMPYGMFHQCGAEQHHGVNQMLEGQYQCSRCVANPPDGLVAVYELLSWDPR